jgi:hypothetical protein
MCPDITLTDVLDCSHTHIILLCENTCLCFRLADSYRILRTGTLRPHEGSLW